MQLSENDVQPSFHFHIVDYLVFGSMLVFSAGVGIYFSSWG